MKAPLPPCRKTSISEAFATSIAPERAAPRTKVKAAKGGRGGGEGGGSVEKRKKKWFRLVWIGLD